MKETKVKRNIKVVVYSGGSLTSSAAALFWDLWAALSAAEAAALAEWITSSPYYTQTCTVSMQWIISRQSRCPSLPSYCLPICLSVWITYTSYLSYLVLFNILLAVGRCRAVFHSLCHHAVRFFWLPCRTSSRLFALIGRSFLLWVRLLLRSRSWLSRGILWVVYICPPLYFYGSTTIDFRFRNGDFHEMQVWS